MRMMVVFVIGWCVILISLMMLFLLTFRSMKRFPNHYKTILFTNARDEKNILEWVVHHLNLGFTHIFLTDHRSSVPISSILRKLPREQITIVREDNEIQKANLMEKAIGFAKKQKYDWMIYLDADEFLFLVHDNHVSDFLRNYQLTIWFPVHYWDILQNVRQHLIDISKVF